MNVFEINARLAFFMSALCMMFAHTLVFSNTPVAPKKLVYGAVIALLMLMASVLFLGYASVFNFFEGST